MGHYITRLKYRLVLTLPSGEDHAASTMYMYIIVRKNILFSGTNKKTKTQNNSKKRSFGCKGKTRPARAGKKNVSGTLQIQENDSRQRKFTNKTGEESCRKKLVNEALQGKTTNAVVTVSKLGSGWSDLIPIELLLMIFQNVIKSICGSSIPFLCR